MKKDIILFVSIGLLVLSIGLQSVKAFEKEEISLEYEYVNTKDMSTSKVSQKKSTDITTLLSWNWTETKVNNSPQVLAIPSPDVPQAQSTVPKVVWHLPTERGIITQSPHYGHAAHDITSPRGSNEWIFPVANGTISGIYTDLDGGLVVTILHVIDGKKYTSQYVHFSSYASGLYVGKEVTINDALGRMGTTGKSTGIHLHLAVVDCALFDPNDVNCSNLTRFFNYANSRVSQGYLGLGSYIIVPGQWTSR